MCFYALRKVGKAIGTGLGVCAYVVTVWCKQSARPLPLGVPACMCAWKGKMCIKRK